MATVSIPMNVHFSGIKAKIPHNAAIHYKGVLANLSALGAVEKPKVGDVYNVTQTSGGDNYLWDGKQWVSLENPDTPATIPSSSSPSDESESESESESASASASESESESESS